MRHSILATVVFLSTLTATSNAAESQKGPAYYTDVHGAAALVRCLHTMSQVDSKYRKPRNEAVNWMLRQMRDFPDAGRTGLQNPSAPRGYQSFHQTTTPSCNFNAQTLLKVYGETKKARLLAAVKEHIGRLKTTALKRQKNAGAAYAWSVRHSIDGKPNMKNRKFLLTSGNSRGFGNILDTLGEYHRVTGDKSVLPFLEGGARFDYLISKKSDGCNVLNSREKPVFARW